MLKGKLLLFSVLLVFASAVFAGDVDDCESDCGLGGDCNPDTMKVTNCPAGDYEQIYRGCGGTGAYIWVLVKNGSGGGIPGVPTTDFWLQGCVEEIYLCPSSVVTDSLTNGSGATTLSLAQIAAGGCSINGGVYLVVQGQVIKVKPACTENKCMDIMFKSPDISGDGLVDIVDVYPFGLSYNKSKGEAGYDPCCDFTDDDLVDISDLAGLGRHYLHECQ